MEITGIRNDNGVILLALTDDATVFKNMEAHKMKASLSLPIIKGKAKVTLHDIPVGKYAISLFHDKNRNAVFDVNTRGFPLEGYGYSNNAGAYEVPIFEKVMFKHESDRNSPVVIKVM